MKVKLLLVGFALILLSCNNTTQKENNSKEDSLEIVAKSNLLMNFDSLNEKMYSTISCDSNELVKIEDEIKSINKDKDKYEKQVRDVFGLSAEGGEATLFYFGKKLEKVNCVFYGEMGKSNYDFYLNNDTIIFVKIAKEEYVSPITDKQNKVKNKSVELFYFINGGLCAVKKDDKLMVDVSSDEILSLQNEIEELFKKIVQAK